jgi:hypothetical protein
MDVKFVLEMDRTWKELHKNKYKKPTSYMNCDHKTRLNDSSKN